MREEVANDWIELPEAVAAIEAAVAASRWRIAARFEDRQTAARFNRLADQRRAAVAAALAQMVGAPRPHRADRGAGTTAGGAERSSFR